MPILRQSIRYLYKLESIQRSAKVWIHDAYGKPELRRRGKKRSSDSVQPHLSVTTLGQPGREPRPGRPGILGLTHRAGYRPRRARSGTVPSSLTKPGISIGPANVSSPGLLEAHCYARTSARSPYQ